MGELVTGIAHEINNPLNNIGLFVANVLDRLKGMSGQDSSTAQLDAAREQVRPAAQIITQLRTFGRASGRSREPLPINTALESAASLVWDKLRLRGISLHLALSPLNPRVQGNGIQLEQVLINLVSNARDALTYATHKQITITTAVEGPMVEVRVHDTGTGIDQAVLPRIFDPFFTTKEVGTGTGLGLSISYGIIKEHQGELDVESQPTTGTMFRVRLPIFRRSG